MIENLETSFTSDGDRIIVTARAAGGAEPVATVTLTTEQARGWAGALLDLVGRIEGQQKLPSERIDELVRHDGNSGKIGAIIEYLDECSRFGSLHAPPEDIAQVVARNIGYPYPGNK